MATVQDIREWMKKMRYPDPNPSEEALQILCRGAMGPIFQQIITNVKPRQEVDLIKKNILFNQLLNKKTIEGSKLTNADNIEQIKLYKEKQKLEKQLDEQKSINTELEANLQSLVRSQRLKSAKIQSLRREIKENKKGDVLYKAKCSEIDKQIQDAQKLFDENVIVANRNKDSTKNEMDKMNTVLAEISEVINKNDKLLIQERKSLSDITLTDNLHISTILSSNRKQPPSSSKRNQNQRLNSTRKNLFESFQNMSTLSTASKARNLSKISFPSFNNTMLSANSMKIVVQVDKCAEIMHEIENLCWNDTKIRDNVENLWKLGWENIFTLLVSLKDSHKKKINDIIINNCMRSENSSEPSPWDAVIGINKLYAFHIQTETDKLQAEKEQIKLTEILSTQFGESAHEITVLKSTGIGLQSAVEELRKQVNRLRQDCSDNSESLNSVLIEIRNTSAEIMSTKSKLETNLCLLHDCNAWLERNQKSVYENVRDHMLYPEYDSLKSNMAQYESEIFISCPILTRNQSYFDGWISNFNNPEVLELIERPFLCPESVIKHHLNEKRWLSSLVFLQNDVENAKSSLKMPNVQLSECEMKNAESVVRENNEKLDKSIINLKESISRFNRVESEINVWLESPLNQCVFPKMHHDGKSLQEYVEMYESYYKKLT